MMIDSDDSWPKAIRMIRDQWSCECARSDLVVLKHWRYQNHCRGFGEHSVVILRYVINICSHKVENCFRSNLSCPYPTRLVVFHIIQA